MEYKELYRLSSALIEKLDEYCYKNDCINDIYYGAKKELIRLQDYAYYNRESRELFANWLKSKSTLDLKKIVNSDEMYDFNVMSLLDTII